RLDDGLIDDLCELHLDAPGPQCEVHIQNLGGAVGRVGEADTAFGDRSAPFVLNAVTAFTDPDETEAHRAWARDAVAAAAGASTGHAYVTSLGAGGAGRSAYADATSRRLAALKATYDPTTLFHLNQNVEPAG